MFNRAFFEGKEQAVKKTVQGIEVEVEKGDEKKQRKIADTLEERIKPALRGLFSSEYECLDPPSERHMADFILRKEDKELYIDIKTKDIKRSFHMPNLISIKRLFDFLDKQGYLSYLFCNYSIQDNLIKIEDVHFVPFYNISLDCIGIGLLGWGQLQIKGGLKIDKQISPAEWLRIVKEEKIPVFYQNEISKIKNTRVKYFERLNLDKYGYLK